MRNEKGFAQVFLVSSLPFLVAALICLYFVLSLIRIETNLRTEIRKTQISSLDRSRKLLQELLARNPRARELKLQYKIARNAYAQACLSGSPAAIALAQANLERVQLLRMALDFSQKALIQAANLDLRISAEKGFTLANQESHKLSSLLKESFQIEVNIFRPSFTKLAVVPNSPDIAPEYRTQPQFSEKQALDQRWQYRIRATSPLRSFFSGSGLFKGGSRITLAEDGQTWRIENRAVKF